MQVSTILCTYVAIATVGCALSSNGLGNTGHGSSHGDVHRQPVYTQSGYPVQNIPADRILRGPRVPDKLRSGHLVSRSSSIPGSSSFSPSSISSLRDHSFNSASNGYRHIDSNNNNNQNSFTNGHRDSLHAGAPRTPFSVSRYSSLSSSSSFSSKSGNNRQRNLPTQAGVGNQRASGNLASVNSVRSGQDAGSKPTPTPVQTAFFRQQLRTLPSDTQAKLKHVYSQTGFSLEFQNLLMNELIKAKTPNGRNGIIHSKAAGLRERKHLADSRGHGDILHRQTNNRQTTGNASRSRGGVNGGDTSHGRRGGSLPAKPEVTNKRVDKYDTPMPSESLSTREKLAVLSGATRNTLTELYRRSGNTPEFHLAVDNYYRNHITSQANPKPQGRSGSPSGSLQAGDWLLRQQELRILQQQKQLLQQQHQLLQHQEQQLLQPSANQRQHPPLQLHQQKLMPSRNNATQPRPLNGRYAVNHQQHQQHHSPVKHNIQLQQQLPLQNQLLQQQQRNQQQHPHGHFSPQRQQQPPMKQELQQQQDHQHHHDGQLSPQRQRQPPLKRQLQQQLQQQQQQRQQYQQQHHQHRQFPPQRQQPPPALSTNQHSPHHQPSYNTHTDIKPQPVTPVKNTPHNTNPAHQTSITASLRSSFPMSKSSTPMLAATDASHQRIYAPVSGIPAQLPLRESGSALGGAADEGHTDRGNLGVANRDGQRQHLQQQHQFSEQQQHPQFRQQQQQQQQQHQQQQQQNGPSAPLQQRSQTSQTSTQQKQQQQTIQGSSRLSAPPPPLPTKVAKAITTTSPLPTPPPPTTTTTTNSLTSIKFLNSTIVIPERINQNPIMKAAFLEVIHRTKSIVQAERRNKIHQQQQQLQQQQQRQQQQKHLLSGVISSNTNPKTTATTSSPASATSTAPDTTGAIQTKLIYNHKVKLTPALFLTWSLPSNQIQRLAGSDLKTILRSINASRHEQARSQENKVEQFRSFLMKTLLNDDQSYVIVHSDAGPQDYYERADKGPSVLVRELKKGFLKVTTGPAGQRTKRSCQSLKTFRIPGSHFATNKLWNKNGTNGTSGVNNGRQLYKFPTLYEPELSPSPNSRRLGTTPNFHKDNSALGVSFNNMFESFNIQIDESATRDITEINSDLVNNPLSTIKSDSRSLGKPRTFLFKIERGQNETPSNKARTRRTTQLHPVLMFIWLLPLGTFPTAPVQTVEYIMNKFREKPQLQDVTDPVVADGTSNQRKTMPDLNFLPNVTTSEKNLTQSLNSQTQVNGANQSPLAVLDKLIEAANALSRLQSVNYPTLAGNETGGFDASTSGTSIIPDSNPLVAILRILKGERSAEDNILNNTISSFRTLVQNNSVTSGDSQLVQPLRPNTTQPRNLVSDLRQTGERRHRQVESWIDTHNTTGRSRPQHIPQHHPHQPQNHLHQHQHQHRLHQPQHMIPHTVSKEQQQLPNPDGYQQQPPQQSTQQLQVPHQLIPQHEQLYSKQQLPQQRQEQRQLQQQQGQQQQKQNLHHHHQQQEQQNSHHHHHQQQEQQNSHHHHQQQQEQQNSHHHHQQQQQRHHRQLLQQQQHHQQQQHGHQQQQLRQQQQEQSMNELLTKLSSQYKNVPTDFLHSLVTNLLAEMKASRPTVPTNQITAKPPSNRHRPTTLILNDIQSPIQNELPTQIVYTTDMTDIDDSNSPSLAVVQVITPISHISHTGNSATKPPMTDQITSEQSGSRSSGRAGDEHISRTAGPSDLHPSRSEQYSDLSCSGRLTSVIRGGSGQHLTQVQPATTEPDKISGPHRHLQMHHQRTQQHPLPSRGQAKFQQNTANEPLYLQGFDTATNLHRPHHAQTHFEQTNLQSEHAGSRARLNNQTSSHLRPEQSQQREQFRQRDIEKSGHTQRQQPGQLHRETFRQTNIQNSGQSQSQQPQQLHRETTNQPDTEAFHHYHHQQSHQIKQQSLPPVPQGPFQQPLPSPAATTTPSSEAVTRALVPPTSKYSPTTAIFSNRYHTMNIQYHSTQPVPLYTSPESTSPFFSDPNYAKAPGPESKDQTLRSIPPAPSKQSSLDSKSTLMPATTIPSPMPPTQPFDFMSFLDLIVESQFSTANQTSNTFNFSQPNIINRTSDVPLTTIRGITGERTQSTKTLRLVPNTSQFPAPSTFNDVKLNIASIPNLTDSLPSGFPANQTRTPAALSNFNTNRHISQTNPHLANFRTTDLHPIAPGFLQTQLTSNSLTHKERNLPTTALMQKPTNAGDFRNKPSSAELSTYNPTTTVLQAWNHSVQTPNNALLTTHPSSIYSSTAIHPTFMPSTTPPVSLNPTVVDVIKSALSNILTSDPAQKWLHIRNHASLAKQALQQISTASEPETPTGSPIGSPIYNHLSFPNNQYSPHNTKPLSTSSHISKTLPLFQDFDRPVQISPRSQTVSHSIQDAQTTFIYEATPNAMPTNLPAWPMTNDRAQQGSQDPIGFQEPVNHARYPPMIRTFPPSQPIAPPSPAVLGGNFHNFLDNTRSGTHYAAGDNPMYWIQPIATTPQPLPTPSPLCPPGQTMNCSPTRPSARLTTFCQRRCDITTGLCDSALCECSCVAPGSSIQQDPRHHSSKLTSPPEQITNQIHSLRSGGFMISSIDPVHASTPAPSINTRLTTTPKMSEEKLNRFFDLLSKMKNSGKDTQQEKEGDETKKRK